MKTIEETKKCLIALGQAWRMDWSDFDGRDLKRQLEEIINVLDGGETYIDFCKENGIHPIKLEWLKEDYENKSFGEQIKEAEK